METKPVFELPKLIALDGREITEDHLIAEAISSNTCHTGEGGGHTCYTGTDKPVISEV